LAAQTNGVRLLYNITGRDGTKTSINELVPFGYTATMFGGRRQWFMCLKCGRRCRRIFGGRYFRCRQCYGLVYASTREPPHQRAFDRADRLRKRVGGGRGAFDAEDFPPNPPRMRWRTYRGGSNNNMRSCWDDGWWVSRPERRSCSTAYDEGVS
jgi:hypothetical protein